MDMWGKKKLPKQKIERDKWRDTNKQTKTRPIILKKN
jgi:hypothetical protein